MGALRSALEEVRVAMQRVLDAVVGQTVSFDRIAQSRCAPGSRYEFPSIVDRVARRSTVRGFPARRALDAKTTVAATHRQRHAWWQASRDEPVLVHSIHLKLRESRSAARPEEVVVMVRARVLVPCSVLTSHPPPGRQLFLEPPPTTRCPEPTACNGYARLCPPSHLHATPTRQTPTPTRTRTRTPTVWVPRWRAPRSSRRPSSGVRPRQALWRSDCRDRCRLGRCGCRRVDWHRCRCR